jgi:hypothetical protein
MSMKKKKEEEEEGEERVYFFYIRLQYEFPCNRVSMGIQAF